MEQYLSGYNDDHGVEEIPGRFLGLSIHLQEGVSLLSEDRIQPNEKNGIEVTAISHTVRSNCCDWYIQPYQAVGVSIPSHSCSIP